MKTQADLARAIDVDPKTVGRWEAGLHTPRPRDLRAIAEATGVEYDWLVEDNEPELVSGRHNVRWATGPPSPAMMSYPPRPLAA